MEIDKINSTNWFKLKNRGYWLCRSNPIWITLLNDPSLHLGGGPGLKNLKNLQILQIPVENIQNAPPPPPTPEDSEDSRIFRLFRIVRGGWVAFYSRMSFIYIYIYRERESKHKTTQAKLT